MFQENSCGGVVFIRNPELQYLLLNYEKSHWGFVKGNVELNESEKMTALRELKEETGITDAKFLDGFRELVTYKYFREGRSIHKQVVFFLIETQTRKIRLSNEHLDFIWVSFIDGLNYLTFDNSKNLFTKAHLFLRKLMNSSFFSSL
jgi:8-oxo-dGTP pyrophosphatase MutT (NUDIX family)